MSPLAATSNSGGGDAPAGGPFRRRGLASSSSPSSASSSGPAPAPASAQAQAPASSTVPALASASAPPAAPPPPPSTSPSDPEPSLPPLYIGLDLSVEHLRVTVIDDRCAVVYADGIVFDDEADLGGIWKTRSGVYTYPSPLDAVLTPVEMLVKALDMLLDKMARAGFNFARVAGVGVSGMPHTPVFLTAHFPSLLASLSPSLPLHAQLCALPPSGPAAPGGATPASPHSATTQQRPHRHAHRRPAASASAFALALSPTSQDLSTLAQLTILEDAWCRTPPSSSPPSSRADEGSDDAGRRERDHPQQADLRARAPEAMARQLGCRPTFASAATQILKMRMGLALGEGGSTGGAGNGSGNGNGTAATAAAVGAEDDMLRYQEMLRHQGQYQRRRRRGEAGGEADTEADAWDRTERIVSAGQLLASLFAGDVVGLDPSEAATTAMWNPRARAWDDHMLDLVSGGQTERLRSMLGGDGGVVGCGAAGSGSDSRSRHGNEEKSRVGATWRVGAWARARYGFRKDTLVLPSLPSPLSSYLSFLPSHTDAVLSMRLTDHLILPLRHHYLTNAAWAVVPHPAQTLTWAEPDGDGETQRTTTTTTSWIAVASWKNAAVSRAFTRDVYCNGTWSAFQQVVSAVPPGGSVGLDNPLISFVWPLLEQHPLGYTKGIFKFELGCRIHEFSDLRANPRSVIESQSLSMRVRAAKVAAAVREAEEKEEGEEEEVVVHVEGNREAEREAYAVRSEREQARARAERWMSDGATTTTKTKTKAGTPWRGGVGGSLGFDPHDASLLPRRVYAVGKAASNPMIAEIVSTVLGAPLVVDQNTLYDSSSPAVSSASSGLSGGAAAAPGVSGLTASASATSTFSDGSASTSSPEAPANSSPTQERRNLLGVGGARPANSSGLGLGLGFGFGPAASTSNTAADADLSGTGKGPLRSAYAQASRAALGVAYRALWWHTTHEAGVGAGLQKAVHGKVADVVRPSFEDVIRARFARRAALDVDVDVDPEADVAPTGLGIRSHGFGGLAHGHGHGHGAHVHVHAHHGHGHTHTHAHAGGAATSPSLTVVSERDEDDGSPQRSHPLLPHGVQEHASSPFASSPGGGSPAGLGLTGVGPVPGGTDTGARSARGYGYGYGYGYCWGSPSDRLRSRTESSAMTAPGSDLTDVSGLGGDSSPDTEHTAESVLGAGGGSAVVAGTSAWAAKRAAMLEEARAREIEEERRRGLVRVAEPDGDASRNYGGMVEEFVRLEGLVLRGFV